MQMFIKSRTNYQIRLRSPLRKEIHLFGSRTCTTSSSLTGMKWCDYQVLRHCGIIAFDYSVFSHMYIIILYICVPTFDARKG